MNFTTIFGMVLVTIGVMALAYDAVMHITEEKGAEVDSMEATIGDPSKRSPLGLPGVSQWPGA